MLLILFVGTVNIYMLNKTSAEYEHVTKINLPNAIYLQHLDSSSRETLRRMLQYTIKGNTPKDLERIDKAVAEKIA